MGIKLHEFIQTLLHEQEVIVIDFDSGDTYISKRKARTTAYILEYNERLRDSKICLIAVDINNATICIHVLKD